MRTTLVIATLLLALATPALAASKHVWFFLMAGDNPQLIHGVPESHALTIAFVCDPKARTVAIFSPVLPRKPRKGQAVAMTLRNGKASAAFTGTTTYDSDSGYQVEAKTAVERKFTDVLKGGTTLTIGVPTQQLRVLLRGVTKPLAEFEKACFGGR
jgi:hypothetical protein